MTSSTAHTAGPWHTSSTHSGAAFDIGAANGANIALVSGPQENGADEFKANARLIAAAPELLAACEAVEEAIDSWRQTLSAQDIRFLSEDERAILEAAHGALRAAIAAAKAGA